MYGGVVGPRVLRGDTRGDCGVSSGVTSAMVWEDNFLQKAIWSSQKSISGALISDTVLRDSLEGKGAFVVDGGVRSALMTSGITNNESTLLYIWLFKVS